MPLITRLALVVAAGCILLTVALPDVARPPCRKYADGATVQFTGVLLAQPSQTERTVQLKDYSEDACRLPIRVRLPDDALDWHVGDDVRVRGRWMVLRISLDGQAPNDGLLIADHASAAPARRHPLLRARSSAQQHLRAILPVTYPLAEALLISQREALSPEVKQNFAASGLTHLLAISGSHVALVAAVVLLLARLLRCSMRAAAIISIIGSAAYVFFLGAPYAALRALIQMVFVLASKALQRPAQPLGMLAGAALIICILDPTAPLDAGFQLSFAGIYGIISWRRPLIEALPHSLPVQLRDAIATTCAATAITTPIAAWHFGVVSVIALVANLLAGPVVAIAVPVTAAALAVSAFSVAAARFIAGGAELVLLWLNHIAALCAHVPHGHFAVPRGAVLVSVIALFLAWRLSRGNTRSTLTGRVSLACLAFALPLTFTPLLPSLDPRLEIHMVDVGQGDGFAIRSPKGRWLLVDAGPSSETFDAGAKIMVPYLLRHDAGHIEALLISHPHLDHFGGAIAIVQQLHVDAIMDPLVPVPGREFGAVQEAARRRRIPWLMARAGRTLELDGMRLDFIAPDSVPLDASLDPNDYSAAFKLSYGRFSALFLGDLSTEVETRLVERYGADLDVDVLKVGHHGSGYSSGDALLATASPRLALISAGRRNRYGHPHPAALSRLEAAGALILRTDQQGSVLVQADRQGHMRVRTAQ